MGLAGTIGAAMEVAFAFLCDYADTSGPKLTAVGVGLDTIHAAEVPVRHHAMYAVAAFSFTRAEAERGRKQVGIHIVDADGVPVMPAIDLDMPVEAPQLGYNYRTNRIALALQGLTFPKFGDYSVSWLVDGMEVRTLPLKVVQSVPPKDAASESPSA